VNNFLGQLNLTAQERRIVVIIFLVVIVVLNLLFVWPRFGDWGSINKQLHDMYGTIDKFNRVIAQDLDPTNGWKKDVAKLARQEGGSVLEGLVDPQVQFQNTIRLQERKTGVYVENINPGAVKTNEFFEEHSTTISVETQEPQLVSFLYGMGNDPAMIRVARLDLKPADANRYRLKGGITLTANYAKKQTAAAVSGPAPIKPGSGAKPAAPPTLAQAGKRPAAGPPAPGAKKSPEAGPRTIPFARPPPATKAAPGQKTPGKTYER
jgi:hypothetical protein